MVESDSNEHGDAAENMCPAMGGVFFTSSIPPTALNPRREDDASANISTGSLTHDVSVNAATTPSPRMEQLLEGLNEPGDSGNTPDPPSWLDRQLFNRGRQFYKRYLFCMSVSDLLALVAIFSIQRSVKPLIYTKKSDTPEKALQRYFSTFLHIINWYTGDVWNPNDPAHKDVLSIRSVHNKYAQLFNSSTNHEKVTNVSISERGHEEPQCPLYTSIQMDMRPLVEEDKFNLTSSNCPPHYLSQFDMSMTQYAFMGLLVSHPEKLGAGAATEEDLEGLIHFWRGIGWLLGIEDKYNFCNGNVAETRALCQETEQLIIIPSLAAADWNYEHMATSLISGINIKVPGLSFPAMFRYLADLMNVRVTDFANQMSFVHTVHYWTLRMVFSIIIIFPKLVLIFNRMLEHLVIRDQNQLPNSKYNFKNLDLKENCN